MARADRLERLDAQRVHAEADYLAMLLDALRETAAGKWGLFGHNEWQGRAHLPPAVFGELCELGDAIDDMRERLFLDPFALHQEFLAARGRRKSSSDVGEPKQARQWLEQLSTGNSDNPDA